MFNNFNAAKSSSNLMLRSSSNLMMHSISNCVPTGSKKVLMEPNNNLQRRILV